MDQHERVAQKSRTRAALLSVTVNLIDQGRAPTVAEAAKAAAISRATAYRYFPSQDLLLVEATLQAATAEVQGLLASPAFPSQVEDRIEVLASSVYQMLFVHEAAFRALLRLSADSEASSGPAARGRRRVHWITKALTPLRKQLGTAEFRRLRAALSMLLGIESLVVLRDICKLSERESVAVAQWAGRALVRAATRR